MKTIKNEFLNEEIVELDHKSGLKIVVIPKEGFAKTYAMFATKFGSVDNVFKTKNSEGFTKIPDGVAHFLEHKLFDNEDGNAFEKYAATGASANAFTGFDKTAYLFSATQRVMESLDILVDFVSKPYFTKESVEKEQGIIGQEIKMYEDDGEWRVLFNLLGALYEKNPVAIDIAGTVGSIREITDKTLYECYHTFYNVHNMVLCVVGDAKIEDVVAICDKHLKETENPQIERFMPTEKEGVVTDYVEQQLPVSAPVFHLGFKDTDGVFEGKEMVKKEASLSILLEMLAGRGSDFYERLYNSGMINSEFSTEYMCGRGFGVTIFGGESSEPKKVQEELLKEIAQMKAKDNKALFERCKKSVYARYIREFNSVESIANNFVNAYFSESALFDRIDVFGEISYDSIMNLFDTVFTEEKMALSVVLPV